MEINVLQRKAHCWTFPRSTGLATAMSNWNFGVRVLEVHTYDIFHFGLQMRAYDSALQIFKKKVTFIYIYFLQEKSHREEQCKGIYWMIISGYTVRAEKLFRMHICKRNCYFALNKLRLDVEVRQTKPFFAMLKSRSTGLLQSKFRVVVDKKWVNFL